MREIAFAVILAVCAAAFTVGVHASLGTGPAWMVGAVLAAAWSWLALSGDDDDDDGDGDGS